MANLTFLTTPWRVFTARLIRAWVAPRLIEPEPTTLDLDPELPVLYVLPRPALSDALLLASLTREQGLPSAAGRRRIGRVELPACVSLPVSRRRLWRRGQRAQAPFQPLIEQRMSDPAYEVQLVPVSVFWGRAPGKPFGFWRLLAADSWQLTGRLRRALSVLVNAKSVEVHFGAPLTLGALLDERDPSLTNRKAARLLRVHFRRKRTQVLGPDLSHRRTLIEGVAKSPEVRRVIDELVAEDQRGRPISRQRLEGRARRYGREIASNMTYPVLRFMDGLLRRLWNRLYAGVEVRGIERVKALAGDHTLVYVPCHRSHIDYLLLSYVLYRDGLMPPHVAAGRNLDMPIIGPLLRRGGAFFLRRSFRDNRLYGAVFNEYLHRLISRGHPLEYFIEGGRSRSGRMLPARPGMLLMTLRSFLRSAATGSHRPLAFVPVYIGYERIIENASYQRELRGARKRKESPLALLRVLGKLRQPFGQVAVNIGEPLLLGSWLDEHAPQWRKPSGEPRPAWLTPLIPRLGAELGRRTNAAAALNPVNLVALVLLATPHHAIERSLLSRQLELLAELQRHQPGGQYASLPEGNPESWIEQVEALGMVERRPHPLGDLILANAEQAGLLGWYRNNVLHLFALAGLAAFAFRHQQCHTLQELTDLLAPGWPILARELTVEPPAALDAALGDTLALLGEYGLIASDGERWQRIEHSLEAGECLDLLGQLMQPSLERGYLLLSVLLASPPGQLSAEQLADQSRRLAERLALLSGLDAPEFFDTQLFASLVESLEAQGWLWREQQQLCYGESLRDAAQRSHRLFDPALRHRLQLITRQPSA
ncbi:glycerol-3-phosphate 1-O-acyltransferase PlsB [Halomonas urumqiensis]|uniref:Glycerol-3-phosphate acyltransferase n=1 Tax=Halomonas urumqiensis TaxID=1684789 RepID=A0A2N7UH20_9GAMM|nr:glycerol-3-phosphate 1-O-acyltransferase PlsB [Halomonas urumqiensis]PMR79705.1 glycerol-3-phosphate 1-O-acyltransferase [Halomonas urumqiensis]PTB03088.1 glycerol-3-phosphate 1-O-acyltransferase [Halomonas urumqiensis]GHE20776.1 glycerol-3-phosphate acyltransferase [Halomonas urumqiensis]